MMKRLLCVLAIGFLVPQHGRAQIQTRWAKQVMPSAVLPEYPRPQLVRSSWINLNGLWQYSVTPAAAGQPASFTDKILVPFPIESALSGVKRSLKPTEALWYQRTFTVPATNGKSRTLLHFGAVDFDATVYVNGQEVGRHTGGYQAFSIDITAALRPDANNLVVRVLDPSDQGPNPHGKQVLQPQGIMYTPSSGIWQTVWLEQVPTGYIQGLRATPDIDRQVLDLQSSVVGYCEGCQVVAIAATGGKVISKVAGTLGTPASTGNAATAGTITLTVPVPNARLWSPDDPFLYDLEVILQKKGKVIDRVRSYFGMRKIAVQKDEKGFDRIFLNNRYTYNLGTLDQGFWPDGLYTAPTDAALRFDIEAAKAMGFNTIRKHIKVEPARWYYHADKLGMLVWQDMVNPGNDTEEGRKQFEKENKETIAQLYNHPSIVTWVLFNEKWGQYDQERLTGELRQLDPTRLVNGHSGEMLYVNDALRSPSPNAWVGADMTDVHAYPNPGHIVFEKGKAAVLGEFGGIGVPVEGHLWDDLKAGWGYDGVVTPPVLKKQYAGMVDSLKKLEQLGLTASIYTQPFDVETEQNGLMTYDREIIKLPVEVIREIHAGLWPATKNYAIATRGFSAVVADTVSKAYASRLEEYSRGNREHDFLRGLALTAKKQKDEVTAAKVATDYIRQLSQPIDESQVNFIEQFTDKSTDPGYPVMMRWVKENRKDTERSRITHKLQDIIFQEQAKTYLGDHPDWGKIEEIIVANQPLDGELIRGLSVIYYLNALGQDRPNAARNLVDAATRYDDLYNSGMYNAWAWALFEKTADKELLEKAASWARKGIAAETDPHRQASAMDTYANVLHKLGRTDEALIWSEKAVAGSPADVEIKTAYEKMKKGERTWP